MDGSTPAARRWRTHVTHAAGGGLPGSQSPTLPAFVATDEMRTASFRAEAHRPSTYDAYRSIPEGRFAELQASAIRRVMLVLLQRSEVAELGIRGGHAAGERHVAARRLDAA